MGSTTATAVYGQAGNFSTSTANQPGGTPTSENLNSPSRCISNSNNDLYCSDRSNNRVLFYASTTPAGYVNECAAITTTATTAAPVTTTPAVPYIPSANATGVYGQLDFTSSGYLPISASSLQQPRGLAVDPGQGVYIADTFNNRVLFYEGSTNTTASRVYGQHGSFITGGNNQGGRSLDTLSFPRDVFAVAGKGVYILDGGNNRVLYFSGTSTTPSILYGQVGEELGSSNGGTGATRRMAFAGPEGLFVDTLGRLYVVDTGNNRVPRFSGNLNIPDKVWGQVSFSSSSSGCSTTQLNSPTAIVLDGDFNLYIADGGNHRILRYTPDSTVASVVLGQLDFVSCLVNQGTGLPSATSLHTPTSVSLDSTLGLFVADEMNNRALYYPGNSISGAAATAVYGQGGNFTTSVVDYPTGVTPSAEGLELPRHCRFSGNLYCSDTQNNRALVYS
jgi:sugar lactone lactonase YvrE